VRGRGTTIVFRLALLAVLGACGAAAPARAAATLVRCESSGFRDNYCPVMTRGGVRLVRQISRAACHQGKTWGYDRHGIWVTEGCVAEFEVESAREDWRSRASPPAAKGEQITCESKDYRYRYCAVRVAREAELVQQLSTSNCRFNRSWGFDRGGVWVDQGCAAVFVVR
jgi:hypothetical protein